MYRPRFDGMLAPASDAEVIYSASLLGPDRKKTLSGSASALKVNEDALCRLLVTKA